MISQQAVRTRSEREGGISGRGLVEGVIAELKKILFSKPKSGPLPPPPASIKKFLTPPLLSVRSDLILSTLRASIERTTEPWVKKLV